MARPRIEQPCRLALIGLMGSGKSAAGRRAAARAGWRFVDLDEEAAARAGRSIAAVFAEAGEETFRDLETEILAEVVEGPGNLVAATGGGVVLRPGNRELLARAFRVVWLDVDPATAAARIGEAEGRPLLSGTEPVEDALERVWAARREHYEALADILVPVGPGRSLEDVAATLAALCGTGEDHTPSSPTR